MFRRFAGGIRRFLREPLTPEECLRIIAEAEQKRDENFLTVLRRAVYANYRSPYRKLLEHFRIEYGDVERDVRLNGVEAAMGSLHAAGVQLGFDEFKGNKRIERPGLSLDVAAEDFDNPLLKRDFEVESSGSTGVRRRMAVDLDALVYDSAVRRTFYEEAGVLARPHALWRAAPPGSAGIKHAASERARRCRFEVRTADRTMVQPDRLEMDERHVAFGVADVNHGRRGKARRRRHPAS